MSKSIHFTICLLFLAGVTSAEQLSGFRLGVNQTPRSVNDLSQKGSAVFAGDFYDVLYHNGYLWIADGGQYYSGNLKKIDVSDPVNPVIQGTDSYHGGSAFRLDAYGDLLFVSVKGCGIKIYDTSDPLYFQLLGEYQTSETINDMDVLGNMLCALSASSGLIILDILDPYNIQVLSQTSITGNRFSLAITTDSLITIASGTAGLLFYSIHNPALPQYLGAVTLTQKSFSDIVCNDTTAYAVYRQTMINSGGFTIVDISEPPNFTVLAQTTQFGVDPFPDNGLTMRGDTLFFAATQGGLGVWNVTDPANPTRFGGWGGAWLPGNFARWSTRCTSSGNYAYNISPDHLLAPTRNEAVVFDLSDLTNPTPIGYYDPPDWVRKAVGAGNYAYVASSNDGLLVVDISNLTNPTVVGGQDDLFLDLSASSVIYDAYYVYVNGGSCALKIFDVSDPTNPEVTSTFLDGFTVYYGLDLWNVLVGVVGSGVPPSPQGWLRILDVSNVFNPQNIGFLDLGTGVRNVDIVDTLAYIAFSRGLGVIDISTPSNPILVAEQSTGGGAHDVIIRDNIAYVADQTSGLVILNVSDPLDPRIISNLSTPSHPVDLALDGDSLYVADSTALLVINVADVYSPVLVNTFPVKGFAQGVSVNDGRIFLCDKYGFHIYADEASGYRETVSNGDLPDSYKITCHPNPFNAKTAISYELRAASFVKLQVYDTAGRLLATLAESWRLAGAHEVTFDGSKLASGVYFVRFEAGGNVAVKKMILLK